MPSRFRNVIAGPALKRRCATAYQNLTASRRPAENAKRRVECARASAALEAILHPGARISIFVMFTTLVRKA